MFRYSQSKLARKTPAIPKQAGQPDGRAQFGIDTANRLNGGLMNVPGITDQAVYQQAQAQQAGQETSIGGRMADTAPGTMTYSAGTQNAPANDQSVAPGYGIDMGRDDQDAGRMPVGLGAGGDPNEWAAGFNGTGLLSDGANNVRMNPGWAASLRQNPTAQNAARYLGTQRTDMRTTHYGAPAPSTGGAQTTGVPDQQAGLVSDLGGGLMNPNRAPDSGMGPPSPLPYDSASNWNNPYTPTPATDLSRPAGVQYPPNAGQVQQPGISWPRRILRGAGAFAAGTIGGPWAGEAAYNALTPVDQRKPRRGP